MRADVRSGIIVLHVSLGFMDRQGVILNEDMKNFTSNMNMNQKMFDGFLNCELGMFGSIQKNHNLVDYQKTFYSAATFNPTYPNHKDPVTNSWDGITTASQITNPLAWMEVQDDDATSHISTARPSDFQSAGRTETKPLRRLYL